MNPHDAVDAMYRGWLTRNARGEFEGDNRPVGHRGPRDRGGYHHPTGFRTGIDDAHAALNAVRNLPWRHLPRPVGQGPRPRRIAFA